MLRRIEIDRRVLRVPEALESQARARQQNDRERDLRNDQRGARPLPRQTATAAARPRFLQHDESASVREILHAGQMPARMPAAIAINPV